MRILALCTLAITINTAWACESELLDHSFRKLAAKEQVNLCETYTGKVLLVVNTASKCGFTSQYDGLEKLHEEYGEQGLVVLGFKDAEEYEEPQMDQSKRTIVEPARDFCMEVLVPESGLSSWEKPLTELDAPLPFFESMPAIEVCFRTSPPCSRMKRSSARVSVRAAPLAEV